MNLKWFSKNIKAVFAEEEAGGEGHPETTASKVKKKEIPVLIMYFPWLLLVDWGAGMALEMFQLKKICRHPRCLLLVKIMGLSQLQ